MKLLITLVLCTALLTAQTDWQSYLSAAVKDLQGESQHNFEGARKIQYLAKYSPRMRRIQASLKAAGYADDAAKVGRLSQDFCDPYCVSFLANLLSMPVSLVN